MQGSKTFLWRETTREGLLRSVFKDSECRISIHKHKLINNGRLISLYINISIISSTLSPFSAQTEPMEYVRLIHKDK